MKETSKQTKKKPNKETNKQANKQTNKVRFLGVAVFTLTVSHRRSFNEQDFLDFSP